MAAAAAADWTFLHNGTDETVESVALWTGATASQTIWTNKTTATNNGIGARHTTSTTGVSVWNVGRGVGTVWAVIGAANSSLADRFSLYQTITDDDAGAGPDGFLYTDSVVASSSAAGAYDVNTVSPLTFCAETGAFAQALTGDINRLLVYTSALDATQRGINEAVDEWALGGTLPVTP